jgi:DNA-binding NarL/FixJ family response regulator
MRTLNTVVIGDREFRDEVKALVGQSRAYYVAGEIVESRALRHLAALAPDVVVLDGGSEGINGVRVLQTLQDLPRMPRIVVQGATGTATERQLMLELGASAYVAPGSDGLTEALQLTRVPPRPAERGWFSMPGLQPRA